MKECKVCGEMRNEMAECEKICKGCCPIEKGDIGDCEDCMLIDVLDDDE